MSVSSLLFHCGNNFVISNVTCSVFFVFFFVFLFLLFSVLHDKSFINVYNGSNDKFTNDKIAKIQSYFTIVKVSCHLELMFYVDFK